MFIQFATKLLLTVAYIRPTADNTAWGDRGQGSGVRGSGVHKNFVRGCSTNSVEDRGQRERGSGGGSPLVRGSAQFVNE
jgi:hypothetical protein